MYHIYTSFVQLFRKMIRSQIMSACDMRVTSQINSHVHVRRVNRHFIWPESHMKMNTEYLRRVFVVHTAEWRISACHQNNSPNLSHEIPTISINIESIQRYINNHNARIFCIHSKVQADTLHTMTGSLDCPFEWKHTDPLVFIRNFTHKHCQLELLPILL